MKAAKNFDSKGELYALSIHCPACNYPHEFYVKPFPNGTVWQWDGNLEQPTFMPSLLLTTGSLADPAFIDPENYAPTRCHSIVTAGKINYCGDCTHSMSGVQNVELPDFDKLHPFWNSKSD